jgi:hypothetical protein
MRLKCRPLMNGPGPSETTVSITTSEGKDQLVVDSELVHGDLLEVLRVLEQDKDRALVELPRESVSGRWRVWVPRSALAAA